MSEVDCRSLSVSGIPLAENRIVRTIYLDESGTSANERIAVVCAVIIDADRQWQLVESYLNDLIAEYSPKDERRQFIFHATRLFSGTSGRSGEQRKRDWDVLKMILRIPSLFGLSLSFGFTDKEWKGENHPKPNKAATLFAINHAQAYCLCVIGCEKFMRRSTQANEIATMVAENTDASKKLLQKVHAVLRGEPHLYAETFFRSITPEYRDLLPLNRIKDTVHFAAKEGAIFLQLADVFGFVMRNFLEGHRTNCDELYEALLLQPKDFEYLRNQRWGGRVLAPSMNQFLNPPQVCSTIPGYGEIRR